MKIRGFLLAILFTLAAMPQLYAAMPIKAAASIAAVYEAQKATLRQYTPARASAYSPIRHKCMVSKIGRGMMIGGGGMLICGIVWGSATPKRGGYAFVPDGAWALLFFGFLAIVLGGFTAIVGGIYNATRKTKRVGFVAPKNNEMGIAYNF